MLTQRSIYLLATALLGPLMLNAAEPAVPADTNIVSKIPANPDYAWLVPSTLPPPSTVIDAAFASMPRSFREKSDWLARMKKASWVPNLELRYGIGEQNFRTYRTLSSETEISTSTETTKETSQQAGQDLDYSPDSPGVQQSASAGSKESTTTGKTVTQSGPTSYGVNDTSHWVNDYGIYLTWDLSRILFREEEIVISGAEKERELFRDSVRQQVIQTYYDLKETLLLLQNEAYKESIPTKIKKERLAFMLDTMTDGSFSASQPAKKTP